MKPQYLGSDRFLHDIVNEFVVGKKNKRKDVAIDAGAQKYGSRHREEFPHQNAAQATMFLCMEDIKAGREIDFSTNAKISASHMFVDKIPSNLKTKFQLLSLISEIYMKKR